MRKEKEKIKKEKTRRSPSLTWLVALLQKPSSIFDPAPSASRTVSGLYGGGLLDSITFTLRAHIVFWGGVRGRRR